VTKQLSNWMQGNSCCW